MFNSVAAIVSTFFGVGYLPIAPGTWCSAVVAGLVWLMVPSEHITLAIVISIAVLTVAAQWSISRVQASWGTDPQRVVIDEAIGMLIVCLLPVVQDSEWWMVLAIVLFRIFDVAKPWPLSAINNRTEAWAVILDDVAAAGYTVAALLLAVYGVNVIAVLWTGSGINP
jgi:phosphatidylglycerophosphatase A